MVLPTVIPRASTRKDWIKPASSKRTSISAPSAPSTSGFRRVVVHRLPAHPLARQQRSRIPGAFGEESHQLAQREFVTALLVREGKQALHGWFEDADSCDVRIVHVHGDARHDRNMAVPDEARSARHDALLRREWLPALGGQAEVEAAGVFYRHRRDDPLAVRQHRPKVALHGCRQVFEFVCVVASGAAGSRVTSRRAYSACVASAHR